MHEQNKEELFFLQYIAFTIALQKTKQKLDFYTYACNMVMVLTLQEIVPISSLETTICNRENKLYIINKIPVFTRREILK